MVSTYSTVNDLLLGDVPLPGYLNAQKFVDDAANEIDSYIGYTYETPIDMDDPGTVARPARLTLNRIAAHLSSGRIMLAIAAGTQDDRLNAYGAKLVEEAIATLKLMAEGEIPIEGGIPVGGTGTVAPTGPSILNIDQFSAVETFYSALTFPATFGDAERVPGG
jgi:phage gp36-like protein